MSTEIIILDKIDFKRKIIHTNSNSLVLSIIAI